MEQRMEPSSRTETERHWDQICLGLIAAGDGSDGFQPDDQVPARGWG